MNQWRYLGQPSGCKAMQCQLRVNPGVLCFDRIETWVLPFHLRLKISISDTARLRHLDQNISNENDKIPAQGALLISLSQVHDVPHYQ